MSESCKGLHASILHLLAQLVVGALRGYLFCLFLGGCPPFCDEVVIEQQFNAEMFQYVITGVFVDLVLEFPLVLLAPFYQYALITGYLAFQSFDVYIGFDHEPVDEFLGEGIPAV